MNGIDLRRGATLIAIRVGYRLFVGYSLRSGRSMMISTVCLGWRRAAGLIRTAMFSRLSVVMTVLVFSI